MSLVSLAVVGTKCKLCTCAVFVVSLGFPRQSISLSVRFLLGKLALTDAKQALRKLSGLYMEQVFHVCLVDVYMLVMLARLLAWYHIDLVCPRPALSDSPTRFPYLPLASIASRFSLPRLYRCSATIDCNWVKYLTILLRFIKITLISLQINIGYWLSKVTDWLFLLWTLTLQRTQLCCQVFL